MTKIFSFLLLSLLLLTITSSLSAFSKVDIVVAQDGSGNYKTIQSAIDAVPGNNSSQITILIKNGIYNEKLLISKSHITLVGESRDSTQIIFAELRSNWVEKHNGDDWGSGTININDNVTDIIFANLTVYNNYGSLFGSNDHQFAIRGFDADRIMLINCNIKADGGDTLSLWNPRAGKTYYYNSYFEGYVDFVCPRGWCYATDCRFYERSATASASIWHDGGADINAKFVIRHSRFEGVDSFVLGRNHRDANFFLLDCVFAENMKDKAIFHAASNPPKPYQWGERYYYYNCTHEGDNYSWHKDNLLTASGAPLPELINAEWTFSTAPEKWNPEANFPVVLPNAELPSPRRNAQNMDAREVELKWVKGRESISHNIYFGTTNPPEFKVNQTTEEYKSEKLLPNTTYYWRIDEVCEKDTVRGEVWSFTTSKN